MGAEPITGVSTTQSAHIHEKAYYRGYSDFLHGRLDSPYRPDTLLTKEWQRGQNSAYFVNLRMLNNGSLLRSYYKKKQAKRLLAKKPVTV